MPSRSTNKASNSPLKNAVKLSEGYKEGSQDRYYQSLWSMGKHRLRVDLHSNHYEFQSHARIHVFSQATCQWNLLALLYQSAWISAGATRATRENAASDETRLLEEAARILS